MPIATPVRRTFLRASIALAWLVLAGCATVQEDPPPPEPIAIPAGVVAVPNVAPPPPAPIVPARRKPAPKPPTPAPRDVVILFQEGVAGYSEVAAQVADQLPAERYRASRVAIHESDSPELLAPLLALRPSLAIAIGREAAEFAREQLVGTPLVFCQVFNYEDFLGTDRHAWGVLPTPPLALQLRGWASVDPSRRKIGLIVSDSQSALVDEVVAIAGEEFEIKYEVSSSDRETLYLFKRLASQVDGFWLVPDNEILSPNVLREMLSYAVSHDVGVLVFNDSLLPWGALLSATTTAQDVAERVRSVLEKVATGATQELAAMTPLAEIKLLVNADVAGRLGVTGAPLQSWVLRDRD